MKARPNAKQFRFIASMPRRLWRVSDGSRITGILVATHDWVPLPIAFVRGTGAAALRLARAIRANPYLASRARDMRHCMFHRLPKEIRSKPLVPVDALGRVRKRKGEERFSEWMYLARDRRSCCWSRAIKGEESHLAA